MLKLVTKSSNKKLGNIASTYRSGRGNVYSTCPTSCPMKPEHSPGTPEIDRDYLDAVLRAVPQGGIAWTYTHFPKELLPVVGILNGAPETTINVSTDNAADAVASIRAGHPTVVVEESLSTERSTRYGDIQVVRCPAEYREEVTCSNCGNGDPLCARPRRNFVVKFTAHGSSKKRIDQRRAGESQENGGCYGSGGPVHLQWKKTMNQAQEEISDGEKLLSWVRSLPAGAIVRHHVLGDLGLQV